MLITTKTKTKSVLPLLTAERLAQLMEAIEPQPLEKDLTDMTVGEFLDCLEEDYALRFLEEKYLYKAIGKMKEFKRQMEAITKYLQINEVRPNAEQERAAVGVSFPDFGDNILLTVTEYFHLHSFDEAEQVKMSNYLLIHRKLSAEARFKYQYDKIIEQRMKQKYNGKRR